MNNRHLLISSYINRAFLEAQIERVKNYDSHMSVMKFEYRFDPKKGEQFKEIVSFMYAFLNFTPIVYEGGNSFMFLIHEMKLHTAVMTVKNMLVSLKIKYGVTIDAIGMTAYDEQDDLDDLLARVHKFYMKSKVMKNVDIYYGTRYFEYGHLGSFDNIRNVLVQEPRINLYGFYKEAPLMSRVEVLEAREGMIKIRAQKEYIPFLKRQEYIYLEHFMIPDVMRADITHIDFNSGVLTLENIKFIDNSPVHRQNVRVAPHRPVKAKLSYQEDFMVEGIIADLSKSSVLFTTQLSKIEELQAKGLHNKEFTLTFHLETTHKSTTSVTVRTMIYKIFGNQIVLNIYPDTQTQADISEYIAMCQNLMLLEIQQGRTID